MNNFQNTLTGQAELKDYYDDSGMRKESIAEAIRRRRKKSFEKVGLGLQAEVLDRPEDLKP